MTTNVVQLTGTAPLGIVACEVNSLRYVPEWTGTTTWTLQVPLEGGANLLVLHGLGYGGRPVINAAPAIIVTNLASPALLPLVINEWLARNDGPDGLADPVDGDFEDWFELYNPNPSAVELLGFHLTDDLGEPAKWTFTTSTVLPPQGFLLVWADGEPEQNSASPAGQRHVNFQLNGDGEVIALFNPTRVLQSQVEFGAQTPLVSQGFYPDGDPDGMTFMPVASPGLPNLPPPAPWVTELRLANGVLTFSWNTVPGQTYVVLMAAGFDAPVWLPVTERLTPTGFTASAAIPVGVDTSAFYRVEQTP